MNKPKLYDSAYPGSMFDRDDGDFVRADDNESLASALLRNLHDVEQSRDDWRGDAIMFERKFNELLKAARSAILALASAAENDAAFQSDYEALDAAIAKASK